MPAMAPLLSFFLLLEGGEDEVLVVVEAEDDGGELVGPDDRPVLLGNVDEGGVVEAEEPPVGAVVPGCVVGGNTSVAEIDGCEITNEVDATLALSTMLYGPGNVPVPSHSSETLKLQV